jgi:ribose transport system ATP-binding protein
MVDAADGFQIARAVLREGRSAFDETLGAGEIIGLAGLEGHGPDAFLEALAGLRPLAGGELAFTRRGVKNRIADFRGAVASGIAYLPRDRRTSGVFPNLSVLDNFAISTLARDMSSRLISFRARRKRYELYRERLSIVAANPDNAITQLSGGNQQKVLLARLLARDPAALLLNDPTRGVDVATRRTLYKVFRELAGQGMTMVILSSEIEELVGLCDRALVFRDYQLSARLSGRDLASERVIAAMFGEAA